MVTKSLEFIVGLGFGTGFTDPIEGKLRNERSDVGK